MQKLLRKIAPATVCQDKLKRLDSVGAPSEVMLYDIYGIVNNTRKGQTDKGEWLQFKGEFEAISSDGEVFVSGACFLPQPFEDMLYAQFQTARQDHPDATVQFACRVSIVAPPKGKPSSTGYEYRCMPLVERTESPIDAIRKLANASRERLALPASSTAKETVSKQAKSAS